MMGDYIIESKRTSVIFASDYYTWLDEWEMLKRMNRNIDIKSRRVQQSVSKLDGFLRAEYNSEKNYLGYYAGLETIR